MSNYYLKSNIANILDYMNEWHDLSYPLKLSYNNLP
jgi:hypothetical protein